MTQINDFTGIFIYLVYFTLLVENRIFNKITYEILKKINIIRIICCIVIAILIVELAIPDNEFTCDTYNYIYCNDYKYIGNVTVINNDNDILATYDNHTCSVHHLDNPQDYSIGTIFDGYRNSRGFTVCVTSDYVSDYINTKNYYNTKSYNLLVGMLLYIAASFATLLLFFVIVNLLNYCGYNIVMLNDYITTFSSSNSPFSEIYNNENAPPIIIINQNNECSVCQDSLFNNTEICIPKCRHLIHKTCYDECINGGHTKCPECRNPMI